MVPCNYVTFLYYILLNLLLKHLHIFKTLSPFTTNIFVYISYEQEYSLYNIIIRIKKFSINNILFYRLCLNFANVA